MRIKNKNKGITLIALVITIIILLILAGVTIATLMNSELINKAKLATEQSEIASYKEKIELIRTEEQMNNKDYSLPTIYQMQERLNKEEWVSKTEIITDEGEEKLKLTTKEGYVFYITGSTVEYKGKSEVEGDGQGQEEGIIRPEVIVKDIDLSDVTRKTDIAISDLFEVIWGSEGEGQVYYNVIGTLTYNNTHFSSSSITNVSELELGKYTISCGTATPSQIENGIVDWRRRGCNRYKCI